jgi:hypothetical protein
MDSNLFLQVASNTPPRSSHGKIVFFPIIRLLKFTHRGELGLTEFAGDNLSPYAILSHTWGLDDEEVTFTDLMEDGGKNKTGSFGYKKIQF